MSWPEIIRPLVETYGPERVRRAALAELEFPPELIHTFDEASCLQAALELEDK